MKLAGAKANSYFSNPDPNHSAVLLYGADSMRVSLKRQHLLKSIVGEKAEEEMRLTRLSGAEVRSDPATVLDGLKAASFFPGPRAVFVEEATDAIASHFEIALTQWQLGDAILVVTSGSLNARSKLRKVFEQGQQTVAIGIYDDPPTPDVILNLAKEAGIRDIESSGREALIAIGQELDPGDLAQFIGKIALYKLSDQQPLTQDDVARLAPLSTEAELDDILHIIAEARSNEVGPVLKRLFGQGINPTTLCISATRHFRALHAAASHPQGPDTGIMRLRPPVFGPRKDRMVRQVRAWGIARLERALSELMETDLKLRSTSKAPEMAVLERAFIRISMLRRN